MEENIEIKGGRANNLKNVDIEIPRNRLVVITGVSGSGKSSLAFDTLYAEGQRRYVESLSAYARQFLGRMAKPECDYIKGIPPAIAIEQKVSSRNPRSTVGTSTEVYEYLRLLFARIGRTFSPVSGEEVRKHSTEDVLRTFHSYPAGTRFLVLAPLRPTAGRTAREQLEMELKAGFVRMEADGRAMTIADYLAGDAEAETMNLVVDRMTVSDDADTVSRLTDSAETAFYEGGGEMMLRFLPAGTLHTFSTRFEADGITFEEPTDKLFAFNSPAGACPRCEGFGRIIGIDEQLVIPDTSRSVYDGAVICWRGERMGEWRQAFCRQAAEYDFPLFKPYFELSAEEKALLWHGTLPRRTDGRAQSPVTANIDAFFDYLREGQYKIQNRVMLARYRGKTLCPDCHGTRLRPEAGYVKVAGRSITDLVDLPLTELKAWLQSLSLTPEEQHIAQRILPEIDHRLQFLLDVGLDYLTLNRLSNSLSGGESQRINLATSLGSSLVGSLYILDEPSIGLHSRDTHRLIHVLKQLRDLGNTVVVVEHDEEIMRAADWIIDIGPDAGRLGGEVVYQGPPPEKVESLEFFDERSGRADYSDKPSGRAERKVESSRTSRAAEPITSTSEAAKSITSIDESKELVHASTTPNSQLSTFNSQLSTLNSQLVSHTLSFLSGRDVLPVPDSRRPWNNYIDIKGARAHNLKGIDVRFPLNVMTCVTGVSGSGKSTLVKDILYLGMKRQLDQPADRPGEFLALEGDTDCIRAIEFVDQNPIGKSTRSNPVTYVKGWDEIRRLYASLPQAQQMGFTAGHFSFNTEGGRCEECKGEGTVTVEMQFMADLVLECEACHGKRFKNDLLEIKFHGYDVSDILDMTVDGAIQFFSEHNQRRIVNRLKPLQDVGLGYIKLGQSSSTLSGGENQRVKLAYYLGQEKQVPTLFIFDEPTTGLHFHDIKKLLSAFDALLAHGHTIVIIEHNLDVIKCADHVIDLGPEGGDRGGALIVAGTPEEVAQCAESYTGQFLKDKLNVPHGKQG